MEQNKEPLGNDRGADAALRKEFDMIDEYVPVKFEEAPERVTGGLEEAQQYLSIVLKELEEAKAELLLKKQEKKKTKRAKFWKTVSLLELILLVAALCFFGIEYLKNKNDAVEAGAGNHQEAEKNTGEETGFDNGEIKTEKLRTDLKEAVEGVSKADIAPFVISAETVYGYEYLCFSYGKIKVYYRNEFLSNETDTRMCMIVDNGSKRMELDWDYDLTGNLALLCPKIGNFAGGEELQLLFITYGEAKLLTASSILPQKLHMVEVNNLWEYNVLIPEETLLNTFAVSYKEAQGTGQGDFDAHMQLLVNSAEYTYRIPKESYINAVYYEENPLKVKDYAKTEITEDAISFTATLYLSDEAYLGQVSAQVAVSGMNVTLENIRYAAYAPANQEDKELGGIIEPYTYIMDEYVTMYGKKGERFIIELSKTLERVPYDWENLKEDANGFLTYYENEEALTLPGIDVSKYQGNIDWDKVKDAGVQYAFIRLGYRAVGSGVIELDPYFRQNIEGASRAGIPIGVYFFSQAVNEEEAIEEAETVLREIRGYRVEYPVVFDTETVTVNGVAGAANHLSRQERTDVAKAFCERIKTAGYTPMIYANTKWMIMGIDLEQLTEYDTWFAYYGDNLTFPYKFQILQYSESGRVSGISSNVDLNLSFVDYANPTDSE